MGKAVTGICEKDGMISFSFNDGNVIPGDVNGDGVVNAMDVMAVVNYTMNSMSSTVDILSADVNGDGIVNIADIVMIVDMIK